MAESTVRAKDRKVSGKTALTGASGGLSGAVLAPLIVWILDQFGIEMDGEVAAVAGGLIVAVVTFVVAWGKPAKSGTYVEVDRTPVGEDYQPKH